MGRNLDDYIRQHFSKAIDAHEITAFYQPVIRTSSGRLCSMEALARWIDPGIGMIYPDEFVPVLEKERLIHLLDAAILRQACARIRSSLHNQETPIPVSVNLSRLDFTLCDIFSVVNDIVSYYQIPHDFLYFEITESVMAEQKELLTGFVNRFRCAGYQIWMDDFGSAYSSLNALKEFSFDELKLDMCFLRPFNRRSKRIATAVVEMAKDIEIHTLAEGVETEEQFVYLRDIGCEKVQGYYFGKPMPYEDTLANLRDQGIEIEAPQDRQYYDEIGRIDFLSSVPFMTRAEKDGIVSARQLNSIPLALAEFEQGFFRILFCNSAFEDTAAGTGLFSDVFSQEQLCRPQPYDKVSGRILNLMDSVRSGGDGKMLFTFNEEYYEIQARRMAMTKDRYSVLIRITNLSKDSRSESTGYLDDFIRQVYAIFERITLINYREDSIRPLYTAAREDMLSGRHGIRALAGEYADSFIFPEDRDAFIRVFDPKEAFERFEQTGAVSFSEVFRTSVLHGRYAWKEYTVLKIDKEQYLLLIRNIQKSVADFVSSHFAHSDEEGVYSPQHMWNSLIRSDLLRLFWKDADRRFIGVSKAFLDYYGFSSVEEIRGKNDEDLGWHIHPDRYMSDELQVIREGKTFRNIPGRCMNNGENKEILASKTPLYDTDGEIRGLLGYFIDRELLTENDKRGRETFRRDFLTGLLNSRGVSEEAAAFRDEYYLRGTDFVRIHIAVNDFTALNEQYGFDFGDVILDVLGKEFQKNFGRNSAVGRYAGNKFVVLHQVKGRQEAHDYRARIKAIGESIHKIGEIPVTLYLSVGYVLFSEHLDLEEQTRISEERLLADHDSHFSAESRITHASEMFHLFDDLPISYSVYHLTREEQSGNYDAVIFYVNRKFEEFGNISAKKVLGHSVRELYPEMDEEWFRALRRAAFDGEIAEGEVVSRENGKRYYYTAHQIIYPGYCSVTYQEVLRDPEKEA